MQITFSYTYLKSLIKLYRKKLPANNSKKQDIKFAVYEEIRKLRYINKISNKYEKTNVLNQNVYEQEIDKAFDKQGHFLRHQQLYRVNSNKIQREISESVRNFIREKLLIKRIERKI